MKINQIHQSLVDETQNIISDAFNNDSLPFEKIMDKMTNACFQDHASTRLSRRKEEPLRNRVTPSANAKDERRFRMMGLPHDVDIEIPDSFFRPKMLQIEEATEANNQAELATTTHESQRKSLRTKTNTNYITYGLNIPVTSWSRKDEY